MRKLLVTATAALLVAAPALAERSALIVGNGDYGRLRDLEGGSAVVAAADALRESGAAVITAADETGARINTAFTRFARNAPEADALAVVLSGRFVHSDRETWLAPVGMAEPWLGRIVRHGLPLSAVLTVLDEADRPAVLVLATDAHEGRPDPYVFYGIGRVEAPDGVVVVRTDPRTARRIVAEILPRERGILRELRRLDAEVEGSFEETAAGTSVLERAVWERARDADDVAGYERYLRHFPDGPAAAEARRRLEALRDIPGDQARRGEETLDLSREQRRQVQRGLTLLGYQTRGIDGIFGPGTRGAILQWQRDNDLADTGYLSRTQVDLLARQAGARRREIEEEARLRRERQEREDRAWWRETEAQQTAEAYRSYLDRFPEGLFADAARDRLNRMEGARAQAYEQDLWDEARDRQDLAAYRRYLNRFPNGRHAEQARRRISELEQARSATQAAQRQEQELNLNPVTTRLVEQRLSAVGLDPGPVDGSFDGQTRRAIRRYQDERDLPATGYLDEPTVVRLLADSVQQLLR